MRMTCSTFLFYELQLCYLSQILYNLFYLLLLPLHFFFNMGNNAVVLISQYKNSLFQEFVIVKQVMPLWVIFLSWHIEGNTRIFE